MKKRWNHGRVTKAQPARRDGQRLFILLEALFRAGDASVLQ